MKIYTNDNSATGRETFWKIRAEHYDKLYWVRDKSYVDAIVSVGEFKRDDLVLDIGTGTGVIARAIKPHVKHVIGLDISDSMLEKGKWEGCSVIKWDISESLLVHNMFNKLVARMVFHHIVDCIERAFLRCHDLLDSGGKLVVAEGVPPVDDPDVVAWYAEMFSHKETRRTFTPDELAGYFAMVGFKNIKVYTHMSDNFSIKNWLENSGLEPAKQKTIMDMHRNANAKIKEVYRMKLTDDDCLITTKNVIVTGEK